MNYFIFLIITYCAAQPIITAKQMTGELNNNVYDDLASVKNGNMKIFEIVIIEIIIIVTIIGLFCSCIFCVCYCHKPYLETKRKR